MILFRNYLLLSLLFFLRQGHVSLESLPISQIFMIPRLAIYYFLSIFLLGLNVITRLYIKIEQLYAKCFAHINSVP